jgi:LmbE family N-acetylglucosaminyl deacetylase
VTVLVLAPHADDEVLGMGGSIARLAADGRRVVVAVLTGHGEGVHPLGTPEMWDTVRAEARTAAKILGITELLFRELPAAVLDFTPAWQINRVVSDVIREIEPDELYVPFAHDLHQDHQIIAYAASVATRPHLPLGQQIRRVLAYETLSETHLASPYLFPAFQPSVFVDISDHLSTKLEAMRSYRSQLQPDPLPRSIAGLAALAAVRGSLIGMPAAEAFVLIRETI